MRCGYGERKEKRGKIKYKVGIRSGRSKKKIEKKNWEKKRSFERRVKAHHVTLQLVWTALIGLYAYHDQLGG